MRGSRRWSRSSNDNNSRRELQETAVITEPGLLEDGHSTGDIPPGLDAILADLGGAGGRPLEPSLKYLHVSIDNPDRMWAETHFRDLRDSARHQRMAIDNQMDTGFVDHSGNLLVSIASALSLDGYARKQALQVDTAQKAVSQAIASQLSRSVNPEKRGIS